MKKPKEIPLTPRQELNGKFRKKGFLLLEDKERQFIYYALQITSQERKAYFNNLNEAKVWIEND